MTYEEERSIPFIPPTRDELIEGIRHSVGISDKYKNNQGLSGTLLQSAADALALPAPHSILRKTIITSCEEGILAGKEVLVASKKLCSLISRMDQPVFIYGFALTLGEKIDRLISESQRTSLSNALLLDAAGSFMVEHYAGQVEDHLRDKLLQEGLELSARFSPGYCDWEIGQGQRELTRFLSPHRIGISLLASGMMSPLKSIAGVFVAAGHIPQRTPCAWCHVHNCRYRR